MKNGNILDFYSDYLITAFGQTTATGLAALLNGEISHDQIQRWLAILTTVTNCGFKPQISDSLIIVLFG